eukprot:8790561-Pyramimonas_sp.AAC.1
MKTSKSPARALCQAAMLSSTRASAPTSSRNWITQGVDCTALSGGHANFSGVNLGVFRSWPRRESPNTVASTPLC